MPFASLSSSWASSNLYRVPDGPVPYTEEYSAEKGQDIVETRHTSRSTANPRAGKPRGVSNPKAGEKRFLLSLHPPSDELGFFVEHYWIVRWGLEPYLQEALPHSCVHLVIEKDVSRTYGVTRKKFSYLLADRGKVFGVKFRPGAFHPFIKSSVSGLTDDSIGLRDAFGVEVEALEETITSLEDEEEMVECAETFIRQRLCRSGTRTS